MVTISPPLYPQSPPAHSITTDRDFPRTKLVDTPKEIKRTVARSSQFLGSTQHALQESLTGNVVFANESLKTARESVLSHHLAETKEYEALLAIFEHIASYNHQDAPLMHNDYARHVHRMWVDTHSQRIRTDPEMHLPGEVDEDTEDSEEEEDREREEELATVSAGVKRKRAIRTGKVYRGKVAKTLARDVPSIVDVIDDCHPDLTLIDAPVDEPVLYHPYGRHSCLYMEVKLDVNQRPNPRIRTVGPGKDPKGVPLTAKPPRIKAIVRQIADTARLHLATRPFMRYSIHITLCGTVFNVCLFDRAGGVVSKDYDLEDEKDFETFIRIIRRATCDMDANALGLDPTVGDSEYYTHGFPIWQSTTLQGRGTWVFGASVDDNPNPMPLDCLILKNAWRAPGGLPESTLYKVINKLPAGDGALTLRCVAGFVEGGDVMAEDVRQHTHFPSSSVVGERQRVAIHVSSHRGFVADAVLNPHDPVLHRVVLATRGRSMASYTSLVELLSAGECAAEGLVALHERGVDHKDVSIGNVFLGTDPSKPAGFIADFDLSSISDEAIKVAYPTEHEEIIRKLKRGEWRTGTTLFMSVELLCAIESHNYAKICGIPRDFTFQHKLCHDFESLIWVIIYAMMIRRKSTLAATNPIHHTAYKEYLDGYWGAHSHTKLLNSHMALMSAGMSPRRCIVDIVLFPDPLEAEFFRTAMRLLGPQRDGDAEPLTYEKVQTLFRTYIRKTEQATRSTLAAT